MLHAISATQPDTTHDSKKARDITRAEVARDPFVVDRPCDIYSFGTVLYQLIVKNPPYSDLYIQHHPPSPERIAEELRSRQRQPARDLKAELEAKLGPRYSLVLSDLLLDLIEECWQFDPTRRQVGWSVIISELTKIEKGLETWLL